MMHDKISVEALLREAAGPFIDGPKSIDFRIETASLDGTDEPALHRRPEIIYGLRNIVENAAKFAKKTVRFRAEWTEEQIVFSVHDDGPGFSSEILTRLGEPYVSSRHFETRDRSAGLGLGFFIAKTLLEGSGAEIAFQNENWGETSHRFGASVRAIWPNAAIIVADNNTALKS